MSPYFVPYFDGVHRLGSSYLRHVAFNLRLAIAIGFLKGLLITALFNTKPAKVDVMSNFDLFNLEWPFH